MKHSLCCISIVLRGYYFCGKCAHPGRDLEETQVLIHENISDLGSFLKLRVVRSGLLMDGLKS